MTMPVSPSGRRARACLTAAIILALLPPMLSCDERSAPADEGSLVASDQVPGESSAAELMIRVFPADGRSLSSLEQPLSVHFTRAVPADSFSFTIAPDPGGWSLEWAPGNRAVYLEHSEPFEAGRAYALDVHLEPDYGAHSRFVAHGPSSLALIDEGAEGGSLDPDTAWTLRMQALFEPRILPARYRSQTPLRCGTSLIRRFWRERDQLEAATIESLQPYLVRPTSPDSYLAPAAPSGSPMPIVGPDPEAPGHGPWLAADAALAGPTLAAAAGQQRPDMWWSIKGEGSKVRVWYRTEDSGLAAQASNLIEGNSMYARFRQLLGREPLSDLGEVDEKGQPNDGGDEDVDIYLVSPSALEDEDGGADGLAVNTREGRTSPGWIMIDNTLRGDELQATLAHELFHVFQFAFDQDEDAWWTEGTATWAEHFIDEGADTEQDALEDAFAGYPFHRVQELAREDGYHEYGAYLFPYYLAAVNPGRAQVIGDVWRGCESTNAVDAVDQATPKGLDVHFKEFAKLCYDIEPHEGEIPDAHGPLKLYDLHFEVTEALGEPREYRFWPGLPPLSATYIQVQNEADPVATPLVVFHLDDIAGSDVLSVQAFIDDGTRSRVEDWSDVDERRFCLNREDERFDNIGMVVASTDRESDQHPRVVVELETEGCQPQGGSGEFEFIETKRSYDDPGYDEWESEYRVSGRIVFDPYENGALAGKAFVSYSFTIDAIEFGTHGNPPRKERYINRRGSGVVNCRLRYPWGDPDGTYNFECDDLEVIHGRDRNILRWTTDLIEDVVDNYTASASLSGQSYVDDYYGGRLEPYALEVSGHHTETETDIPGPGDLRRFSVRWSFRLEEPEREQR